MLVTDQVTAQELLTEGEVYTYPGGRSAPAFAMTRRRRARPGRRRGALRVRPRRVTPVGRRRRDRRWRCSTSSSCRGWRAESTDARHRGEIEVEVWSWGGPQQRGRGWRRRERGGRRAGDDERPALHRPPGQSLAEAAAGLPARAAHPQRGAGGSRATSSGAGGDFLDAHPERRAGQGLARRGTPARRTGPRDQVSLGFGRITIEYRPRNPDDGALGPAVRSRLGSEGEPPERNGPGPSSMVRVGRWSAERSPLRHRRPGISDLPSQQGGDGLPEALRFLGVVAEGIGQFEDVVFD